VDDQGYLWAMPTLPNDVAGSALDVFDPEGRYLGRITTRLHFGAYRPTVILGNMLLRCRG
jgi:hypothetical protein